jgi:hypothetical protein
LKILNPVTLTDITVSGLAGNSAVVSDQSDKLVSSTVTTTELNYLSGVTSLVQNQLNNKQPLNSTLTALAAFNTNGVLAQTATGVFVGRTITGTTNRVVITNGNGVSGNPTLDIGADVVTLTGSQSLTNKTITGTFTGSLTGNASTVTTNANLTGDITSIGNTTTLAANVVANVNIKAAAAIDATKIANGTVSNTAFQYLSGVTSAIQTQFSKKADLDVNGKVLTSQIPSVNGLFYVGATAPTDTSMLWQPI